MFTDFICTYLIECLNNILIVCPLWSHLSERRSYSVVVPRKMQVSGATDLASKGPSVSDTSNVKPKEEFDDPFQSDSKTRCPCGSSLLTDSMIKVVLHVFAVFFSMCSNHFSYYIYIYSSRDVQAPFLNIWGFWLAICCAQLWFIYLFLFFFLHYQFWLLKLWNSFYLAINSYVFHFHS